MKSFSLYAVSILVAVSAGASLVPVGPVPYSGTGIGAVNTVLTLGDRPVESGCVARGPAGDIVGPAACPPGFTGGDERTGASQTQTRTIAELGLTTATDLRIVINVNESVGNRVSLANLQLTIFDPAGAVLFTSGPFTPPPFTMEHLPGTTVGYVFELDEAQAAQAQLVFDPTNRVGFAATFSGTSAGNETNFVADVTAIGTPLFGADLVVAKSAPASAIAGTTLTYAITVRNDGPEAASNVVLSDPLPPQTRFAAVTAPAGWTCSTPPLGDAGTISCSKASMAIGETATFTATARVCPEIACGTAMTNTASASSATPDPVMANSSATTTTNILAQSDLAVAKTASSTTVNPGGTIIYTVTVTNGGPSNSAGTTISDTLPAGFTATSVSATTGTCSGTGTSTVTCMIGTLGAADQCTTATPVSATVTITAQASPSVLPGTYTNAATADTANCLADPNTANNTATVTTTVPAAPAGADVAITKTAPSSVIAGENLTYTITVTNSGPDAAANVVVSDPLPAQTVVVSQSAPAGWSCSAPSPGASGTITCSKNPMAVAESATLTTVVRTCPEITCGSTLTNTATAASTTADPLATNNTSTATVAVQAQSDVAITKTASAATVQPGGTITYTLNVSNAGPSNSVGTTVADSLPAGFIVASVVTSAGACSGVGSSSVNCALGDLGAAGQCATALPMTAVITLVAQAATGVQPGTVVNTVTVATANCLADPNPANNTATAPTAIEAAIIVAIPTLSDVGMAVFVALLLLAGLYVIRT